MAKDKDFAPPKRVPFFFARYRKGYFGVKKATKCKSFEAKNSQIKSPNIDGREC